MNLLIVDDDIPTTEVVRDLIKGWNLPIKEVTAVYNVLEAKSVLEKQRVDIVICDIEMPKYSGLDLLEWVRQRGMEQEFIFLTCHADFDYAAQALRYKADAYITKPLNCEDLKSAMTKVVEKILYQRELKRSSQYGQLWLDQEERMKKSLWREILFVDASLGFRADSFEAYRKAGIEADREYQLVLCSVLYTDLEVHQWDPPVFRYALGNIAGEILLGGFGSSRVFDYSQGGRIYVAVVADSCSAQDCRRLADSCQGYLQCKVVVYYSGPCPITQLSKQRLFWEQADRDNVTRMVPVIEDISQLAVEGKSVALDVSQIQELIRQGKSLEAVNAVHKAVEAAEKSGHFSAQTLHEVRQDFTQAVFSCLAEEHVLAHELFQNPSAQRLEKVCESSVFDMIKWMDYMMQKAVETIGQVRKSENVVEKMKRYIEEHLDQELSREEIARYVYLSPDYASKLFKTETGSFLKTYINDRKMERAKSLLAERQKNVSEVAAAVGFDNFAYFSTLFKKCTGVSPNEYKKQHETFP